MYVYVGVSVCICTYLYVFVHICLYLCLSHSIFVCAQAQTAAEIDELRTMTTKVVVPDDDGDGYITKDMRVFSAPVRMIIDVMAFTGTYGHRSTLESKRTNLGFRNSFHDYITDIATNRADEFWASWKEFRARNPLEERPAGGAPTRPASVSLLHADSEDEALLNATAGKQGDTSRAGEDPGPSGPAAPAAPAAGAAAG